MCGVDKIIISDFFIKSILSIFSLVLKQFFISFSNISFNRNAIGNNLVLLSSIVFIVIVIVKNSLALSLGLVGALSIVRFRTPIKEPCELIYLFF